MWSGELGQIVGCGAVSSERYLCLERCVGTDNLFWCGVLGLIFECGTGVGTDI